MAVQPGFRHTTRMQLLDTQRRPLPQLVQRAELDRVRRARFRTRRLQAVVQPVVAHRALPRPAVTLAPFDHPVRAARHAIAAPIANVLLHNDCAELGAEQRARRAHVQTPRVRAVLAHVGAHQPPEIRSCLGARRIAWARKSRHPQIDWFRRWLLDERHMPPRVRAQLARVVERHPQQVEPVVGHACSIPCRPPRTPCSRCTPMCR